MSSRLTSPLLFLFVALLSTVPRPASSELVHGFLKAYPDIEALGSTLYVTCGEAFDFSSQTIVRHDSPGADLCFFAWVQYPSPWIFKPLAVGLRLETDTSLEDLLVAPVSGYSNTRYWDIRVGDVYTVSTDDGFYAKFRVHSGGPPICCSITIEYYVQMDGSRNLDQQVPAHSTTWGRVKALYQ